MDEVDVVTQTLNSVIQRHVKSIHAYEIEITNMMADIIRLQKALSEKSQEKENSVPVKEVSPTIKK